MVNKVQVTLLFYSQSDKLVSPANVVTGMSLSFIMDSLHLTEMKISVRI